MYLNNMTNTTATAVGELISLKAAALAGASLTPQLSQNPLLPPPLGVGGGGFMADVMGVNPSSVASGLPPPFIGASGSTPYSIAQYLYSLAALTIWMVMIYFFYRCDHQLKNFLRREDVRSNSSSSRPNFIRNHPDIDKRSQVWTASI